MNRLTAAAMALLLCIAPSFPAAEEDDTASTKPEPRSSVTEHEIRIDGQRIEYTAETGWLILERDGEPAARFGYTAYTRDGDFPPAERPLMFAFNGGPGSSSIWLHMGILGPERVVVNDAGYASPPPVQRVDNAYSIIDVADLVMVDPVGTGFSKPLGDAEGSDFWGVDQDIESVAAFIKRYVTANGRWASPKFVLGESYGGIRGAGLAHHLQSRHGMNLNGLVLVSPFLSEGAGRDRSGLDLPHALFLPAFAAAAWYHEQLEEQPDDFDAFLSEVEAFALGEYLDALNGGHTIDDERKRSVAERVAGYTGTDADYWLRADLRVSHGEFLQELQRDDEKITGRIDARFVGPMLDPLSGNMDYDPFFPAVGPAYTAAFLDYLHNELDFGTDLEYRTTAWPLDWDWTHEGPDGESQPAVNLLPDLSRAIVMNPGLRVLVQQGYYDLATPYSATTYYLRHLDIPEEARDRVELVMYPAGHMMYLHDESMSAFREDLAAFVGRAVPGD
ncbi:MAG: S10 family peptidase [Candidatus Wenzhouxiangella sp. M2_3B_020]